VGLLVMAGLVVWLQPREPQSPAPNPSAPVSPNLTASRENPVGSQQNTIGLAQKLQQSLTMLQKGPDVGKVRHGLAELSQELGAAGTNAASAAIRRFLDSGSDGPTGMQFKVGARGTLEGAPTLRTFLLDYLGQIDPAAAASYSKAVLSASQSPDEWALALRNIARGDGSSDARALLEQKTSELLRRDDWQHDPTVGYLEAFDVAVYLGGTNLAPVLE